MPSDNPGFIRRFEVFGWSLIPANSSLFGSLGFPIGNVGRFDGFDIGAVAGSGGPPGGSTFSFPGNFGRVGTHGNISINGGSFNTEQGSFSTGGGQRSCAFP